MIYDHQDIKYIDRTIKIHISILDLFIIQFNMPNNIINGHYHIKNIYHAVKIQIAKVYI